MLFNIHRWLWNQLQVFSDGLVTCWVVECLYNYVITCLASTVTQQTRTFNCIQAQLLTYWLYYVGGSK